MADQDPITFEAAMDEVTSWLDHKKVNEDDRKAYAAQIKKLATSIQNGSVSMDGDTFVFTQQLEFPLTDSKDKTKVVLDKLSFKPRVTVGDLKKAAAGVKASDFDGKVAAYISLLSDVAQGYIDKLDSEDLKIGQAIAVFFL